MRPIIYRRVGPDYLYTNKKGDKNKSFMILKKVYKSKIIWKSDSTYSPPQRQIIGGINASSVVACVKSIH